MTTNKKTDARKLDHATLEAMRLRAIEATKAGMKATDLALAYGVHRRTVFRWLADYYKGGEQALKAKPIPGRPPKLVEPQMQSLAQAVTLLKSTSGLRPSGGGLSSSLCLKLLCEAHASIKVPSTLKCSSLVSLAQPVVCLTRSKNTRASLLLNSLSRLALKDE